MVYGPEETVPVIVLNIGDKKTVCLKVEVVSEDSKVVYEADYINIRLPEGRTVTKAADVKLPKLPKGLYSIRYVVFE